MDWACCNIKPQSGTHMERNVYTCCTTAIGSIHVCEASRYCILSSVTCNMYLHMAESMEYCKTSNTSPQLLVEQMPWTPRLVLLAQLLLKHRQLATLNFFVYVRYT